MWEDVTKLKVELPLDRLEFVDKQAVLSYIHKVGFLETVVYYVLDYRTRQQIHLLNWLRNNLELPGDIIVKTQHISLKSTNKEKMLAILKFVHLYIDYKSDKSVWNVEEKWQTPMETWGMKTGDCEDGALLIYALAKYYEIPDIQLYIVAGEVGNNQGHCYIVYISEEDGLGYPIDWCYWYDQSVRMDYPYVKDVKYMGGLCEWWRFNSYGCYKLWRK